MCKAEFVPKRSMQTICDSFDCAVEYSSQAKTKKAEKIAKRADRERTKERKDAAMTLPRLHKLAKEWFNRRIRLRDQHKPCISCGRPLPKLGTVVGGAFDCGHFRSVGSAGHLRYHPDNAAGQCKDCNIHGQGMYREFRVGLIQRIGLEAVLALENNNAVHKWTHEELRQIIEENKALCKELEKQ